MYVCMDGWMDGLREAGGVYWIIYQATKQQNKTPRSIKAPSRASSHFTEKRTRRGAQSKNVM
jgi:hypothetical protein